MTRAGLVVFCALLPLGANAAERSVWTHNGSLTYLVADGTERVFRYLEPRPGMVAAGAVRDAVLFQGRIEGNRYVGTATMFHPKCGMFTYAVSGTVRNDDRRVVLNGEAPRIGRDCRLQGTRPDTLTFDYAGTRDIDAAAPAAPAASFPPAFRGFWKLAGKTGNACPTPRMSLTSGVIQVEPGSWKGWESGCDLTRIETPKETPPDGQSTIQVEMSCFVEANSYRSREMWQVRRIDGRSMLVTATLKTWDHRDDAGTPQPDDDEPGIDVYVRCD